MRFRFRIWGITAAAIFVICAYAYAGIISPSGGFNSGGGGTGTPTATPTTASNSVRLDLNTVAAFLPALPAAQGIPTQVYCADAQNGSNSNTGIAAGVYPNYTNCKQTAQGLIGVITAGSASYMTGVFRDTNRGTNGGVAAGVAMMVSGSALGGTQAIPTILSSFGPPLFNDPISGATGGAIIDGSDCLGTNTGDCATNTITPPTWTNSSGNIWKTPYTSFPWAVYLDNITTWPDGPNADGAQGLIAAGCVTGPCANSVTFPATLSQWAAGTPYTTPKSVQDTGGSTSTNNESMWFTLNTASCTAGATHPTAGCQTPGTCTAGVTAVSDGACSWTFQGVSAGKVGPMQKGSWAWDGQSLYVWTPSNDSPANHVIEAVDHSWGIRLDGNAPNFNHFHVQHLMTQHTGGDGLLLRSLSATTCETDNNVIFNAFVQTGPSNVDLGNFFNGMRFEDAFSVGGGAGNCSTSVANIEHNYIAWNGDHGGSLTEQVGNFPLVEAFNNIFHPNHGGINNVGAAPVGCTGCQIIGNYVHEAVRSFNGGSSVGGIFQLNGANVEVAGNYVQDIYDQGFCGGGQCLGVSLQTITGGVVDNNTIDHCQVGLGTTGGTTTHVGNLYNNIQPAQSSGVAINTHTGELSKSDFNVLSALATPVSFNGTLETLAAWQATAGTPDTHSLNSNASFSTGETYPFILSAGSAGIGLSAHQGGFGGFGAGNAGANQQNFGWAQ